MSTDNTAQLILDTEITNVVATTGNLIIIPRILSVGDLKAMARLWLMRKEVLKFFADLDSADKTESWAWNISERLRQKIEALEKE